MLDGWLPASEVCKLVLSMQDARTRHIAPIWRARSFRETEREPMTIRRAMALNAVIRQCDLPLIPGELLLGSGIARLAVDGDAREIEEASAYLRTEIGSRSFHTHFDHHAPDYPTLLREGIGGLRERALSALEMRDDADARAFLESVIIALDGVGAYIGRWADAAESAAADHPEWSRLLVRQAKMLRSLSDDPPRTFWEAVQLVYLFHCVFQLDERYAMAFGRIDQYLLPFYQADIASGEITRDVAQAIMDHLFAKLAHRSEIQNICIGGVTLGGGDATNEISFMVLESVKRIGQPGGNVTARIHRGTPEAFLRKCVEVIRTGIGYPAVFNDEVEIPGLVAEGYPLEDARDYCFVGCIECFIPGKQAPWADSRFNMLRCVNLALHRGWDEISSTQMGPRTAEPASWEEFYRAFVEQLRYGVERQAEEIIEIERKADSRARDLSSPLLSALTSDCIERGLDVCDGGARYPGNHGVCGMGIGSTADALAAIKKLVYDEHRFSLDDLRAIIDANFVGFDEERRILMKNAPKYGNDEPSVDAIAVDAARAFADECAKYRTPSGGLFWGLMAANVQNIGAGREVGATADGRLAFEPVSDAASPTFGRDRNGPTAVIKSISKLDYSRHPGGNVINMKFHPSALAGEEGTTALSALIRTCFELGGIQLQFNTTDRDVLMDAMEHPENHEDLVVRVSGFSSYFVRLDRAVQEDVLSRTEHVGA